MGAGTSELAGLGEGPAQAHRSDRSAVPATLGLCARVMEIVFS